MQEREVMERVMSHFKPHPILFCVLYTKNKICLNQWQEDKIPVWIDPESVAGNIYYLFNNILFMHKVHRKALGVALGATLPSPIATIV